MLFPIDHGNSAMKTVNFVFPSGLIDNPIRPPVDTEMLEYDGKFWTLSGQRISYMRDKTKDERYFILTLFAIAKELEKSGNISPMVEADLAVGLPPEHYALRQRFADYFKRGRVNFVFNGAPICLMIRHVFVYPQAYAAVVPQAGRLKEIPRTFIIDIGGYTTDVMLLRNASPDLQFCRSLEMGVIPMSNDIISRVSAMYDIKIEDDHIADIIQGRPTILPQEVHWVSPDRWLAEGTSEPFSMRIRYRQPLQAGTLHMRGDGAYILFETPQRGITAGQFAAWYRGEELVGSGVIAE